MSLPDFFQNQEQYDDWLDDVAEHEIEEFLDVFEDMDIHVDAVYTYATESPQPSGETMEWVRLHNGVREYAHVRVPSETVVLGEQNPFPSIARVTEQAVRTDLGCRMQEMLEQRGHEVVA